MPPQPWTPELHPLVLPLMHWHPSFGTPLQLLSFPASHVSGLGEMLHVCQLPPAHDVVPPAHVPLAPRMDPQDPDCPLMHLQPSFGTPLQLLSFPASHVSVPGVMLHVCQLPPAHDVVPPAHVPLAPRMDPHDPDWPLMHRQPSFATPLQLLSFPASHVSGLGETLQVPQVPSAAHVTVPPAHVPLAPSACAQVSVLPGAHAPWQEPETHALLMLWQSGPLFCHWPVAEQFCGCG
jgi:hypothetical protein